MINFNNTVERQYGKKIKCFRSNSEGEFTSNPMKAFYAENGIVLETTCPHTPQQNKVAERKHRQILEIDRVIHFEANLPIKFWANAF